MYPEALTEAIRTALHEAAAAGVLPVLDTSVEIERPRDRAHGDWSTNVALAAAKEAGRQPREVAAAVLDHLPPVPHLESAEVAGPGFINFRLSPTWLLEVLRAAAAGPDHARSTIGAGERIQVEFVSANPNGPLHIGHARGAVLGDALCNVLDYAGFDVTREYYFNDGGVQMDLYAASIEARYLQVHGIDIDVPDDGYRGDYIIDWANELVDEVGDDLVRLDPEDRRTAIFHWGLERAMSDIRQTLDLARIRFDVWFSEQQVHDDGSLDAALTLLDDRGFTYRADDALWFRTSTFGDVKDRVLVKSDGSPTYLAPDIAYHRNKFERSFSRVINIWGADHHGYIDRMKAAVAALGYDPRRLEIIITQLVNLTRAGAPVRMSTRAGELITFREVLDEVGVDAARYFLVAFSPDTAVTFDLELAKRRSMDNPVYYLQYAHARVASLLRFAAEQGVAARPIDDVDLSLLTDPAELDVLRQVDRLREEIEEAARRRAPHRIATYGQELAGAFHKFYTDCRVVTDDAELTQARMWLVEASRSALVAVLGILGLTAPEEM